MDQFYLTLPSNSSMEFYPNNTTAKFTTQLRRRITLHGNWEVGLVEIHFPHSFFNVRRGENIIRLFSKDGSKTVLYVPPNYYRDKDSFYAVFNKALMSLDPEDMKRAAGLLVEREDGTVQFLENQDLDLDRVKPTSTLAKQLGFQPGSNLLTTPISDRSVDLNQGLPQLLYCYCDVIEEQLVGDASAPLLRIVNTEIKDYVFGRECTKIFDTPIYQKREFNTIEIDLRDGNGNVIPFAHGTSAVLLDFRRVKES